MCEKGIQLSFSFFIMSQYHESKLASLAVHAYMVASNVTIDRQRRADCIEFIHSIKPQVVELNFEGNRLTMPLVICNVLGIIRAKSVNDAHSELIRFFPQFKDKDWTWGAMCSQLFVIDKPVH